MAIQLITIGFDGPNRVGKGTQSQRLHQYLKTQQIPSIIIRGAGSRLGLGLELGDPQSDWWQNVNQWIRTPKATYHDWDVTSARLARELIVWRDRVLPNCAMKSKKKTAVLIIDRTLLSRTMTLRARQAKNIMHNLYPPEAFGNKRKITGHDVCPDIIFQLTAPPKALLSRLKFEDPKYAFRKRLIESTANWFTDADQFIPKDLQTRITKIDATPPIEKVFSNVIWELETQFSSIRTFTNVHRK